jgi:hypothetical protein
MVTFIIRFLPSIILILMTFRTHEPSPNRLVSPYTLEIPYSRHVQIIGWWPLLLYSATTEESSYGVLKCVKIFVLRILLCSSFVTIFSYYSRLWGYKFCSWNGGVELAWQSWIPCLLTTSPYWSISLFSHHLEASLDVAADRSVSHSTTEVPCSLIKLLQRCTTFFVRLATPRVCHLLTKQPKFFLLQLILYFQYEPITPYGNLIHCCASNYRPSFVTTSVTKDVTVYTASGNSAYSYCWKTSRVWLSILHVCVCVSSNSPNFRRNLLICLFIKRNRWFHWISYTHYIFHDSDKAAMWTSEMGATLAPFRLQSRKFIGF